MWWLCDIFWHTGSLQAQPIDYSSIISGPTGCILNPQQNCPSISTAIVQLNKTNVVSLLPVRSGLLVMLLDTMPRNSKLWLIFCHRAVCLSVALFVGVVRPHGHMCKSFSDRRLSHQSYSLVCCSIERAAIRSGEALVEQQWKNTKQESRDMYRKQEQRMGNLYKDNLKMAILIVLLEFNKHVLFKLDPISWVIFINV